MENFKPSENKSIILYPDRAELYKKLEAEGCGMLGYVILTGKHVSGSDCTQAEYDEDLAAALSDD